MLRTLIATGLLIGLALNAGCSGSWGGGSSTFAVRSNSSTAVLVPALPTGVYRWTDANSADLLLTDLPLARLIDENDSLSDASGVIVHVHLFLVPAAGKTPIDASACNVAVRQFVISSGAVGIYGGGGFMYPSGTPGDATFGGELVEGSVRLVRATPNFDDLLGPSTASGSVRANLDQNAALAVLARVEALSRDVPPLPVPK